MFKKTKGRVGPGKRDGTSMRVLNRLVHWSDEGIEYEADQRHAEIIIQETGIERRKQERQNAQRTKQKGRQRGMRVEAVE